MTKRLRDFGEFPARKGSGDTYYCEICRDKGTLEEDLAQCPECGRWVCDGCWDVDVGVCRSCSRKNTLSETSGIHSVTQRTSEKLIPKEVVCPFCGSRMPSSATYCGVCGNRINIERSDTKKHEILMKINQIKGWFKTNRLKDPFEHSFDELSLHLKKSKAIQMRLPISYTHWNHF